MGNCDDGFFYRIMILAIKPKQYLTRENEKVANEIDKEIHQIFNRRSILGNI